LILDYLINISNSVLKLFYIANKNSLLFAYAIKKETQ
jgi:hypothetical protein